MDSDFNLLVGNPARKWCLKLIVCLAAGTMLELLLETKGVKGLKISFLVLRGKDRKALPTVSYVKHLSVSFKDLGSVLGAHTKLAGHPDIQKSKTCREFYLSHYSE